jgi:hypothetical protein
MHLDLSTYSPLLFVDRDMEIDRVLKKVEALTNGNPILRPSDRVVHFPGFAGFGKTWLLCHLVHLMTEDPLKKIPNALVLHIRLNQDWLTLSPDTNPDETYDLATRKLLKELHKRVPRTDNGKSASTEDQDSTLYALSAQVQKAIHDVLGQQYAVVLLVDDLDEVPGGWLNVLEERLFAPLVTQEPQVLLVLAGRNLNHNWATLALKPSSDEQSIRLRPLSQGDTQRQLERLAQLGAQFQYAQKFADQIHALTDGVPEGNALVASKIGQPPKMPGEIETVTEYNARLLEQNVRKELHWCFYALCVSRGFDTEWMECLLPIADPNGRAWGFAASRALLSRLTATRLVRAHRKDGVYRYWLDEYLCRRLALELRIRDSDLWRRLHCAALHMFVTWLKDPKFADQVSRWKEEAYFHIQCLQEAGYDPQQCPNADVQLLSLLAAVDLVALRQILATFFNEDELRDLCFELSINYDGLGGQGTGAKARELVEYCERRGNTARLEHRCRELRPNAFKQ